MVDLGYEIEDPFRIGHLPVEGTEQEVAIGDSQCRSDTALDAAYDTVLQAVLDSRQAYDRQAIADLNRIAAQARQRHDNWPATAKDHRN
jgi:hypothetical protein